MFAPSLRVLIACEFTGTMRREFDALGHDVWSCDTRAALDGSNRHIRDDVRNVLGWGWDLLIVAHPPCTRLTNSGVRWLLDPSRMQNPGEDFTAEERAAWPTMGQADRLALMQLKLRQGAELFSDLWNAPIDRVACENPIMHKYAKPLIRNYEEPAQTLQPWQFGDWESKRTCWWLRGLPTVQPTYKTEAECREALGLPDDAKPEQKVWSMSPGPDRGLERSKFFPGMAKACALAWAGRAAEAVAA